MSPPLSGLMPSSKTSVFTVTNRVDNLGFSDISAGLVSIATTGKLADSPNTPGAAFVLLVVGVVCFWLRVFALVSCGFWNFFVVLLGFL